METEKESKSKKAKTEYGPNATEVPPEISDEKMEKLKELYLEKHVNISEDKINAVEVITRRQSATAVWRDERKKRITSSNFGNVYRRNPNIAVKNLVKQLIYPTFRGNTYTRKGIQDEVMTIKEYESRKEEEKCLVRVEAVGLVICSENKFLATSPDGRVVHKNGEVGLIEIKNLLQNKPINLYEAAKNITFCLQLQNNKLHLKTNHNYYYQIQGQLNIMKLPWVDFVVRTEKPYQLHVERINRDILLWENEMLPKLKAFFFSAVLPELVAPTFNTVSGIREPGCWYTEVKRKNKPGHQNKRKTTRTAREINPSSNFSTPSLDSVQHITVDHPIPSASTVTCDNKEPSSSVVSCIGSRSRRLKKVKFVGRRIAHEWIEDEVKNIKKWYFGTVTSTLTGKDGDENAVYEVLYDGDDEPYSVDHLLQDFKAASVKFVDL